MSFRWVFYLLLLFNHADGKVYHISILSTVPSFISDLLPLEPFPAYLRPLFSVGVHDMATLSRGCWSSRSTDEGYGWIACTSDRILSQKPQLYDLLVHVPPPHSKQAKEKVWPRMQNTKSSDIKATQRDLRRYRALRQELRRFTESHSPHATPGDLPRPLNQDSYDTDTSFMLDADLAEPQSIPALLYNSFMFWASAGEQRTDLDEEAEHDAALLRQIDTYGEASPNRPRSARKSPGISPGMEEGLDKIPARFDISLVAYFHRFTTLILKTLADIIDDADAESASDTGSDSETARLNSNEQSEEEEVPRRKIIVQSEDMTRIGLDSWSESDRIFVQDLIAFYWGREAEVRGGRIECCGVRIC